MNTKIELEYEGQHYTLEYDRAGIKMLESYGFNIDEFLQKPITNTELAFQGAFLKNHPNTKLTTINDIFKDCPDKSGLVKSLHKMITDSYDALLAEPEDDDPKKVQWKTVDLTPKKESKTKE